MNQQQVILHFSLIDGIGPSIVQKIIHNKSAQSDWADLYSFTASDWMQQFGFTQQTVQKIIEGLRNKTVLEKELDLIERNKINVTTFCDERYPELLKHIHLPPTILYWHGAPINGNEKRIAIVGSRKANQYGEQIVDQMVPIFVAHDVTIISRGALGLDSMAHQATLDSGGKTIVVLGSGILKPSPWSHRKLFDQILEDGASIVSGFPASMEARPENFPARNRIIAGMSNGTIVVQAAKKSGARITAQYALEQGRDVFAVPGPIDDPLSAGCHSLIQEGAKLVAGAYDVLVEYGIEAPKQTNLFDQSEKLLKKSKYASDSIEAMIIQACVQAQSTDELAAHTKRSLREIQTMLFTLQLDGAMQQDFTGMWKRA